MAASSRRNYLWIPIGAVVGTATGEILARLLPSGSLTRFLTTSVPLGTSHPLTLDIRVLEVTLGALLRLNLLGVVGTIVVLVAQFRRS